MYLLVNTLDFCYGKEKKRGGFGSKLNGYAVYKTTTEPAKVASKKGNNWLINDMHGNVWEWCADWYGEYKFDLGDETGTPIMVVDPTGSGNGESRVLRGGSFRSEAKDCRSAKRRHENAKYEADGIGFRVVLVDRFSPFFVAFQKLHLAPWIAKEKEAEAKTSE